MRERFHMKNPHFKKINIIFKDRVVKKMKVCIMK